MKILLVVTNSEQAIIYSFEPKNGKYYTLIEKFTNEEGRMKRKQLESKQTGQYGSDAKTHSTYSHNDPYAIAVENFARKIANYLNTKRTTNCYQQFVIIAASHFLGLVIRNLDPNTLSLLKDKIKKDYIPLLTKEQITISEIAQKVSYLNHLQNEIPLKNS